MSAGVKLRRVCLRRCGGGGPQQEGSASVELAIGMSVVVLIIALILAVSSFSLSQQRLCQAAGEAARAAAEGQVNPEAAGAQALASLAGRGAVVETTREGQWVSAQASMPSGVLLGWAIPDASCAVKARVSVIAP